WGGNCVTDRRAPESRPVPAMNLGNTSGQTQGEVFMSGRSIAHAPRVLATLLLGLLLVACGRSHDGHPPALQGAPAAAGTVAHPAAKSAFALILRFNAALASAQSFDELIAVTGPKGEVVSGSWSLLDDGRTLSFPFVQANTRYAVELKPALLAADGRTLGHALKHEVYSGNLPAAVGFASHGSVLPARGTR